MLKKEGYWETYYVCSICGEHSSFRYNECPFCHNSMKNPEQPISLCEWRDQDRCDLYCEGFNTTCEDYTPTNDKETHGAGTVYDWDKPHEI